MISQNGTKTMLLFGGFAIFIAIFGAMYAIVLNSSVNPDVQAQVLSSFKTMFIVNAVLIGALTLLALFAIKSDPSIFQTYTIIILHVSLLLSLLSVSYSTIVQTNN